jgi:hypothetical protein
MDETMAVESMTDRYRATRLGAGILGFSLVMPLAHADETGETSAPRTWGTATADPSPVPPAPGPLPQASQEIAEDANTPRLPPQVSQGIARDPNVQGHLGTDRVRVGTDRARVDSRWYGWQTLAFDTPALALLFASDQTIGLPKRPGESDWRGVFRFFGVGTYALDGLVVHLAHGHHKRILASAAFRAAGPVLGAFFGGLATGNGWQPGGWDPGPGAVVGAVVGCAVSALLDAAVLGWEAPRDSR